MVTMLGSDGYSVDISVADDRIGLTVIAGPGACEECLVPKEVLAAVAKNMLATGNISVDTDDIEIVYPTEH